MSPRREADAEARDDLERDYRDAARDAAHQPPAPGIRAADWKGPDLAADPSAPHVNDLHVVRTPTTSGQPVRPDDREAGMASPPVAARRRDGAVPLRGREATPASPLSRAELDAVDVRARFNRPVSRIEIRRLVATVHALAARTGGVL